MPHLSQSCIVAVAGRRVDALGAAVSQFPLERVPAVREAIAAKLAEWPVVGVVASAACGADLLALDAASAANIPVRIVLPFAVPKFRETSVIDRPDPAYWGPLYDRLIAGARSQAALIELQDRGSNDDAYALANQVILREAQTWAASSPPGSRPRLVALLVWNGVPRKDEDATEQFGQLAVAAGFARKSISTI